MLGVLLAATFALASAGPAHAIPRLTQCANNIDDDGDGAFDYPADPGCGFNTSGSADDSENSTPMTRQCNDGLDNNADGRFDYPRDPRCGTPHDNNEGAPAALPQCGDLIDNDADGTTNYPADPGCVSASDPTEVDGPCADARDNDGDGKSDFPLDWGCAPPTAAVAAQGPNQLDASEVDPPQCNDGRDNDNDGKLDTDTNIAGQTADPGCASATDNDETDPLAPASPPPACSDGIDNDLDGRIDFPSDAGCISLLDTDETGPPVIGLPVGPNPQIVPSGPKVYPPISPFPVIRLRGKVDRSGVTISLLRVQAPNGTRVTVYCYGRSCRLRKRSQTTVSGFVRVRRFEHRLRAGTTLAIYVTKRGYTGKYTRFRIRRNQPPGRFDSCARSAGAKAVACPVN